LTGCYSSTTEWPICSLAVVLRALSSTTTTISRGIDAMTDDLREKAEKIVADWRSAIIPFPQPTDPVLIDAIEAFARAVQREATEAAVKVIAAKTYPSCEPAWHIAAHVFTEAIRALVPTPAGKGDSPIIRRDEGAPTDTPATDFRRRKP
jgi:hypothetical protein